MSKQTMTTIDPEKIRAFVAEKGAFEVTKMLGKSPKYFKNIYDRESMPVSVLNAMCAIFGVDPESFKPEPPKPMLPTSTAAPRTMPSSGYALDLDVQPAYVSIRLYEDSKMLKQAKARIKNGEKASQLDVVQAISYAAHMLYKFMEQDAIE